jgi:hypothetical protein
MRVLGAMEESFRMFCEESFAFYNCVRCRIHCVPFGCNFKRLISCNTNIEIMTVFRHSVLG